jgi:hypothetical protein
MFRASRAFPFLDRLHDIANLPKAITSALRFWPWGPLGIAGSPALHKLTNACPKKHGQNGEAFKIKWVLMNEFFDIRCRDKTNDEPQERELFPGG